MNAAELKQRGYAHQRAGTLDPELAREDSAAGRAYRDGIREARRDAEDKAAGFVIIDDPVQPPATPERIEEIIAWNKNVMATPPGWLTPADAPVNGTPVEILCGDNIYTGKLEGVQWYGSARILGTNKVSWHATLPPDGWRRLQFSPREAKEAAANPGQVSFREKSTSAEQPPPRPPKANAFFEPPTKPAKRPKKKADAEQLDLL